MNKLYRFSPIKDETTFKQVLEYLTSELEKLAKEILNKSLPITTLKVFPHYPDEYEYLYKLISKMGPKASFSSATSLYVSVNEKINNYNIEYLGVRIVDPYRLQVGCGDYEVDNFAEFKKQIINTSPFIREMKGKNDMLELWHPNFDILGYTVPSI